MIWNKVTRPLLCGQWKSWTTFQRPCSSSLPTYPSPELNLPEPHLDWDYILDEANREEIRRNISSRKGIGDIDKVHEINLQLQKETSTNNTELKSVLLQEALKIPNQSHAQILEYGEEARVVKDIEWKSKFGVETARPFEELMKTVNGARTGNLNHYSGEKTYYLTDQISELEQALIHYTLDHLPGFSLVSVPDLLHPQIIERCGMPTQGNRTQVYHLDSYYGKVALSGTSEMALCGLFLDKKVPQTKKLVAVSRCFRAETSKRMTEKSIYRVHQFSKVEMFALTNGNLASSDHILEEFLEHQDKLFSGLGLSYRILDMPLQELGAPAYRKFDIEAVMPGRPKEDGKFFYGEISSCSNCTDYQSRRLNIRDNFGDFCHSINGTACAVPRMIMAICEQYQRPNGIIVIPDKLRKYMRNAEVIEPKAKNKRLNTRFVRSPKYFVGKTSS